MAILRLVFCLFVCVAASCQTKPSLDSLGWLAGCWEGNSGQRRVSEQWMKSGGRMMLGMSRTVQDGVTREYEFLRVEEGKDGIIRYTAFPSGQAEATFVLVSLESGKVAFENSAHDFPQRIIYTLISPDSLVASIEGTIQGKQRSVDFPYRRVDCR